MKKQVVSASKSTGKLLGRFLRPLPPGAKRTLAEALEKSNRRLPRRLGTLHFVLAHELLAVMYAHEQEPHEFLVKSLAGGARLRLDIRMPTQSSIFLMRDYEPHLSAYLRKQLRSGDTFLDIGSHVGYYSIIAAQQVGPQGKVVAIEASQRSFSELTENVRLNGYSNVICLNRALSDRTGSGVLNLNPFNEGGNSVEEIFEKEGHLVDGNGKHRNLGELARKTSMSELKQEVQMADLDSLLPEVLPGSSSIRCAKIDVEGHELKVLQGMRGLLASGRLQELIVEVSKQHRDVFELLRAHRYLPYLLRADASPEPIPDQAISDGDTRTGDYLFRRGGIN